MGLLSSVIYSREFQLENSVKPGKNNKDGHLMLAFGETASCWIGYIACFPTPEKSYKEQP